jgi:hypothetical protein
LNDIEVREIAAVLSAQYQTERAHVLDLVDRQARKMLVRGDAAAFSLWKRIEIELRKMDPP